MPAPSATIMKGFWKAGYPHPSTPYLDEYTDELFDALEAGWASWQKSITFGGLTVQGAGLGAWAGVGSGGIATGSPFNFVIFPFYQNTPQHQKFLQGLQTAIQQKFLEWVTGFSIPSIPYLGTSSASPVSPGSFVAQVVPTPVGTLVSKDVSGIADLWQKTLTPPDFNLQHPQARTKDMVNAVSEAIEKAFTSIWGVSTNLTGSTAQGVAAIGAGTGIGTSSTDGKLV